MAAAHPLELMRKLCRVLGIDAQGRAVRSIEFKVSCDEAPTITVGEWITEGPAAGLVEVLSDYRLVPVGTEGA